MNNVSKEIQSLCFKLLKKKKKKTSKVLVLPFKEANNLTAERALGMSLSKRQTFQTRKQAIKLKTIKHTASSEPWGSGVLFSTFQYIAFLITFGFHNN